MKQSKEKLYKAALEIILKFCEKDHYTNENIKVVCETVLKDERTANK